MREHKKNSQAYLTLQMHRFSTRCTKVMLSTTRKYLVVSRELIETWEANDFYHICYDNRSSTSEKYCAAWTTRNIWRNKTKNCFCSLFEILSAVLCFSVYIFLVQRDIDKISMPSIIIKKEMTNEMYSYIFDGDKK